MKSTIQPTGRLYPNSYGNVIRLNARYWQSGGGDHVDHDVGEDRSFGREGQVGGELISELACISIYIFMSMTAWWVPQINVKMFF